MGGEVDLFSIVPVKRSHSVCAQGGINAAKNLKGEGRLHLAAFRRHHLRRRFPCQPAAGQGDVRGRSCDHRPARSHGRAVQSHPGRPARLPAIRRHALQPHGVSPGATTGQQLLYALDEQVRRYESEGKVKKYEHWEFLSAVLDGQRVCRGICAMDLRTMEVRTFPADAIIIATGGIGADLRQVHQLGGLHRIGAIRALPAGRLLRERRVHSGSSHLHSRRRQAAAHVGVGARRRRTRVGSEDRGRQARSEIDSRERALVFPRRVVSQVRQPRAARRGHARDLQSCLRAQPWHRRQADGLSRPDAYRPQDSSTASSKAFSKSTRSLSATIRAIRR